MASAGDSITMVKNSLKKFIGEECDIIVCAIRSNLLNNDTIKKNLENHDVEYIEIFDINGLISSIKNFK